MKLCIDCRHYLGDRPCIHNRLCDGCPHYDPPSAKMLIIKLGAAGDVLRTTPLLRALKARDPRVHITWLTGPGAFELLGSAPLIDRLLPFGFEALARLRTERFDEVYCFDKEAHAAVLAVEVDAPAKIGFGFSPQGGPCPLNPESDYLFSLGLSDELKFRVNRKTYQELIFEAAGLKFGGEEYVLDIPGRARAAAREALISAGASPDRPWIGVNTGAGPVFANKAWTEHRQLEFFARAATELEADILLLGGPDEAERNAFLRANARVPLIDTGCHNTLERFAALVGHASVLVTGDTLAMHLAIGQQRPVVVLFGSTCAQEVELYGRGEKIVTPLSCSPCYRRCCDITPSCMEVIEPGRVLDAVRRALAST